MKNFREIELLSTYLDGHLSASESTRLESRLISDVELVSILSDLRATRGILRKLPARKAPHNFTLTRKMVGLKPPLPRAYPIFRFSTVVATLLLVVSFTANLWTSQVRLAAPAPQAAYGVGGSGGGGPEIAAATEAPAAEAPLLEMAPPSTAITDTAAQVTEPAADAAQTAKQPETESGLADPPEGRNEAVVPALWQIALLVIILLSGLLMWVMRQSAARKWR